MVDERPVAVNARRELTLLARLLLYPGRVVPADRLVDAVWDGEPPPSASGTLRVLVSRLRGRLADVGGEQRIVTDSTGYALALRDDDEYDATQFEAEIRRGGDLIRAGSTEQAREAFAGALSRWRGEAFGDLASLDFVQPEAVRLEESWFTALEGRIECDMQLGRHRDLVAELESLCAEHPLREVLWAQLMIALYRGGRKADALRTYQRLRETLADLVGLDPTPEIRALEASILGDDLDTEVMRSSPALPPVPEQTQDFVGRDDEMGALWRAWESAIGGARQVALVHGEPGAGSSRLAHEFARRVRESGGSVAEGSFDEEQLLPYDGFLAAVRRLQEGAEDGAVGLADLVGHASTGSGGWNGLRGEAEFERHRLHRTIEDLLRGAAASTPLLVLLDDLHWADVASQLLLRHLVERLDDAPVLIVCTYRDTLVDGQVALLSTLSRIHRSDGIHDLPVGPLGRSEIEALLSDHPGAAKSLDHLVDVVFERTGGNAFFASALALAASAGSADPAVRSVLEVPTTVREFVLLRVARLSRDSRRLLSVASACAGSFRLSTLVAVNSSEREDVIAAIDECARAHLLRPGEEVDRLDFVHALVRDVVYESLSPLRRADIHERIADALQLDERYTRAHAEIARHLAAAPPTVAIVRRRIEQARLAGDDAMGGLAFEAAADHYGAAVEACDVLPDPDAAQRCDLLLRTVRAMLACNHPTTAATLAWRAVEEARAASEPAFLAAAALLLEESQWIASGFATADSSVEVDVVLREAIAVTVDPATRLELLSRWPRVVHFGTDPDERTESAREAIDIAESLGDDRSIAVANDGLRWAIWGAPGLGEERARAAAAVVSSARSSGHVDLRTRGLVWTVLAALEAGDRAGLDAGIEALRETGRRSGESLARWFPLMMDATCALLDGRLDDAEAAVVRSVSRARQLELTWAVESAGIQLQQIRREQGRLDELVEATERSAARHPDAVAWQLGLADLRLRTGDREGALALVEAYGPRIVTMARDLTWSAAAGLAADLVVELETLDVAGSIASCLDAHVDEHLVIGPGTVSLGSTARHLGSLAIVLGDLDVAADLLDRAMRDNVALAAPLVVARTHLARHRLFVATGRDANATEELTAARVIADGSESVLLRQECEALT